MKAFTNIYAQKIYEILIPMIGELMARATIKSRTAIIGVNEEKITKNDLSRLAEEIKKGLVVFLGSDSAEKVASKISGIT